jgi:peroxin-11B
LLNFFPLLYTPPSTLVNSFGPAVALLNMVADALVYHPAVTHYLRYVATTVGRDKVLRTVQYFSRFYAWYLYRTNNPSSAIEPWSKLKTQFALVRKVLRIGKFVEHIRAASEIYDASQKAGSGDKVTQYLQLLRQVGYGGYMTFDTLTVLDALGVKKWEGAKRLQVTAYRFWLTGLLASTLAGIYTNYKLRERAVAVDEKDAEGKVEGVKIAR